MKRPQIRQVPPSRSTANSRVFSQPFPRYVVGPPDQLGDFSAVNAPDVVKHSREQNLRLLPLRFVSQGFSCKTLPHFSQDRSTAGFHDGLFSPRTISLVNALVGRNPLRYVLPVRSWPRMTRLAICHAPPHAYPQNVCGFPLTRLVNVIPHCLHCLVTIFMRRLLCKYPV